MSGVKRGQNPVITSKDYLSLCKIGAVAIAAATTGLHASHREGKAFNPVLCPSHITGK